MAAMALAALLATGCVVHEVGYQSAAGAEVTVGEAPPAPLVETVTEAPDPTFVWIGGNWVWRNHWVWEHGRWARPPHPGAVWVPHSYVNRGGRHVWVRGGWR